VLPLLRGDVMNKSKTNLVIGTRIKEARLRKGYTQEQMAGELNFSKSYIRKFEQGARLPNITNLLAISYILEVDPGSFLSNINPKEAYEELIKNNKKE
jgi:transcriptional regulator with XRE-family HTH domain